MGDQYLRRDAWIYDLLSDRDSANRYSAQHVKEIPVAFIAHDLVISGDVYTRVGTYIRQTRSRLFLGFVRADHVHTSLTDGGAQHKVCGSRVGAVVDTGVRYGSTVTGMENRSLICDSGRGQLARGSRPDNVLHGDYLWRLVDHGIDLAGAKWRL